MKYLSIDIEATGLHQNCLMIEFAMIPFDTQTKQLEEKLAREFLIKCPSFEELKSSLDPWVIENNEILIRKASSLGIPLSDFNLAMTEYLESSEVKEYFENKKIVLFGKSLSAIDLPFLNRDLGWDFMRHYFNHRQLDLSSICYSWMDLGILPSGMESGSNLMQFLAMGDVAHTALEDAKNTAIMYLKLLEQFKYLEILD